MCGLLLYEMSQSTFEKFSLARSNSAATGTFVQPIARTIFRVEE
jgi:hypothetical protein